MSELCIELKSIVLTRLHSRNGECAAITTVIEITGLKLYSDGPIEYNQLISFKQMF